MKFKYQFVFEHVGPIIIGVMIDKNIGKSRQILKLNETSYDVAKHLVSDHDEKELVDLFLDEYSVDRIQAEKVVSVVMSYLQSLGVLVE